MYLVALQMKTFDQKYVAEMVTSMRWQNLLKWNIFLWLPYDMTLPHNAGFLSLGRKSRNSRFPYCWMLKCCRHPEAFIQVPKLLHMSPGKRTNFHDE